MNAAPLTTRVARSDLLALGALLHDIGKGRGTDHCVLGAELTIPIANRLGLSAQDTDTLAGMVRHHLLLPITATRSDLNDPKTIASVAAALHGDPSCSSSCTRWRRPTLRPPGRGVERLEGLLDRRPGPPLPAGDGR